MKHIFYISPKDKKPHRLMEAYDFTKKMANENKMIPKNRLLFDMLFDIVQWYGEQSCHHSVYKVPLDNRDILTIFDFMLKNDQINARSMCRCILELRDLMEDT
ncbi:MAG: hypothetical protein EOP48_15100 [Sphingobacteriales bacterium]|nr:MAG: hypothetical protein EOP48_15100 [Sphingobacteriales bacterium]